MTAANPTRVLAIDPGSTSSAFVVYDWRLAELLAFAKVENAKLTPILQELILRWAPESCAIELTQPYPMRTNAGRVFFPEQVMTTAVWAGRFAQILDGGDPERATVFVDRKTVKATLLGRMRAGDSDVRSVLIARFGGAKIAKGTKANPGQLYGVTNDCWSALALAIVFGGHRLTFIARERTRERR